MSALDIHLRLDIVLRPMAHLRPMVGLPAAPASRCAPWRVKSVPLRDLQQYTLAYTGGLERRCGVRDRRRMQNSDRTP
jgi:hypothetical protein